MWSMVIQLGVQDPPVMLFLAFPVSSLYHDYDITIRRQSSAVTGWYWGHKHRARQAKETYQKFSSKFQILPWIQLSQRFGRSNFSVVWCDTSSVRSQECGNKWHNFYTSHLFLQPLQVTFIAADVYISFCFQQNTLTGKAHSRAPAYFMLTLPGPLGNT